MKIIKYVAIALMAFQITTSCNKFLDINPAGEVVNNEMFDSPEGFEEALYGVYATLGSENLYAENLGYYVSDVAAQYLAPSWSEHPCRRICVYDYEHKDIRQTVDTIWISMYANIANVNNVLENLDRKESKDMKMRYYNLYYGEALALRAFMHFELTRYYCDNIITKPNTVGIPYRESYSFKVFPFEPLKVTYEKIIRDLKAAEELMAGSDSYYYSAGDNPSGFVFNREIHISIDAVKAILARVYWTMNDLESASKYALEVIQSKRYTCVDDTKVEDLVNGVLSPDETIFGVYSLSKFGLSTQKNLYYTSGYDVKADYQDWYDADRDGYDSRKDKWFKTLSDFGASGLRFVKIMDWYTIKQLKRPEVRVSGMNIIRIPEMYYIVAEYYILMQDFVSAHRYFDAVIAKRGLVPYSQRTGFQLSVKNLNVERRKEYVGEGQYFHVMKRYNMDGYDKLSDRTFSASNGIYILPIPQGELDFNPIK